MDVTSPTARVERAAREDWDAATVSQDQRRRVLKQFVPAADRLSDHALERQMELGMRVAAEAASVADIPDLAWRYANTRRRHQHLVTTATRIWTARHQSGVGMKRSEPQRWMATAGSADPFKSEWERRLAAALDRLGIVWQYESTRLRYTDGSTGWRSYVPDFVIVGMDATFIEVKGPAGADAADAWKMRLALKANPWATILLWDAATIEYVEDCQTKERVMALARTTKFGATITVGAAR